MDRVVIKFPVVKPEPFKRLVTIMNGRPKYLPDSPLNGKLPEEITTEAVDEEIRRLSALPHADLVATLRHSITVSLSLAASAKLAAACAVDSVQSMNLLRTAVAELPNVMILDAVTGL